MVKKVIKYILYSVIVCTIVSLAFYVPKAFLSKLEAKENKLRITASKNESIIAEGQAIEQENKDLKDYISKVNAVKSKTNVFKDKLANIEKYIPEDVTIQNLSYDKKNMQIRACTQNNDSISEFAANLQLSGKYKNVRVLDIQCDENTKTYLFYINILY